MQRLSITTLFLCLAATPALPDDAVFDTLVSRMEIHYKTKSVGAGIAGFFARCFSPKGAQALHMAVFGEIESGRQYTPEAFEALVRRTVGTEVQPILRVRGCSEQTLVFLRKVKGTPELLIVTSEPSETVVMTMKANPEHLRQWLETREGKAEK